MKENLSNTPNINNREKNGLTHHSKAQTYRVKFKKNDEKWLPKSSGQIGGKNLGKMMKMVSWEFG